MQLLRCMQQLLGDKLGTSADANSFLHEFFLQRLPANVRMVLASADSSTDLDKLADMADKVMEVATHAIATVSATHANGADNAEVKQLREKVTRLTDLVASLTTRPRRRSSSKPRRTPSPAAINCPQESLCWYHAKFGEAAQKCREPCIWGNFKAGY